MSNQLTIKDGKFYRNGVEEKPEFGNREQINAIQKEVERQKRIEKGVPCDVDFEEISHYEMDITFPCMKCKRRVWRSIDTDTDKDYELAKADKETATCQSCKTKHELIHNQAKNEIVAILKT